MHYVKGTNRYQVEFMCLDQMVEPESIARIIDAFVNSLDMGKMGFQKRSTSTTADHPTTQGPC